MSKIPDEALRAFTPCWAKVYVQTSPADAYLIPASSADELALRGEVMGCSLGEMAANLLACREALRVLLDKPDCPNHYECGFCSGCCASEEAARACLPEYDV